jgi:hypothetical protein
MARVSATRAEPRKGTLMTRTLMTRVRMTCWALGVGAALAVLVGAAPASATAGGGARDGNACAQQYAHLGTGASPSCGANPPGLIENHNETLVREGL